ncbi:MAG: hypothetical protein K2Q13_00055 [Nitrosomonas sp.]|uniref:DUF5666 domain-containing protein n=1 Tax=Nitrosomonas sp. TaxID=42353 RepID=UPI0025EF4485|nr:DUF5666 domain-containing protein [Nitrosomonas sp.]MBY0473438.1 hypothetical protein [Nitrosomonas sp.]
MTKTSLTALYRYGAYTLGVIALMFFYSVSALAKNNCDVSASLTNPLLQPQSGIGGTGTSLAESGVGGTGVRDGGMGGTGVSGGGIGGTGAPVAESGVGGTGVQEEGGIGGTGHVADDGGLGGTGIIGVITGFASICVNGIEVHYDSNTPISIDGRASTARDLAVGQVVAARALGAGQELTARNIAVVHAAIGPISNINSETGEMRVLDQTVHIGKSADHDYISNMKVGDWVQVSGHRQSNGAIIASRIETTPPHAQAKINGHITQIDTQGFVVNGTRVQHDAKSSLTDISQGMEIEVTGQWDGIHLHAQKIQVEPMLRSVGNVEHLVIEGYIHALSGEELNVSNRKIIIDSDTQLAGTTRSDLKLDQRVLISGRLGADQRIILERIEVRNILPLQIQEGNDRAFIDNSGKGRNNTGNESEVKPSDSQGRGSGHEDGSQNSSDLKKGRDLDSGNNQSSGRDSRMDRSSRVEDEREIDHSGSTRRDSIEKSSDMRDTDASDRKSIMLENPRESGSDVRDRPSDHKDSVRDTDTPDRARDHAERYDKHLIIDRHERPDEFDSGMRDRIGDHRESIRDIDIPDRVGDHRESIRDIDIPDRIRD